MNSISNIGGSLSAWVWVVKILLVTASFVPLLCLIQKKRGRKRTKRQYAGRILFPLVTIVFLFLSFGSGKRVAVPAPKEEGVLILMESVGGEKGRALLNKENEEKKPEVLKRQSEVTSGGEADDYINNALRRWK